MLILALALDSSGGDHGGTTSTAEPSALPAIAVSAPPPNTAIDTPCTTLSASLPVTIDTSGGTLQARPAESTWTYVYAWGNPAVVLICGVPRPAALTVNSGAQVIAIDGVNFFTARKGSDTIFTAIDRTPYIEVDVPTSYTQPPIAPIAAAIAKALPQVCTAVQAGQSTPPSAELCTHRK